MKDIYTKRTIYILLLIVMVLLGWILWDKDRISKIDTYEKCVAAGYPVQEKYPPVCAVPGGKMFTQTFDGGTSCTMEAKVCPDGSAVGRQGPNCEFAACPGE